MLPDIQPGNTKILYFFNCLLDGMHTNRLSLEASILPAANQDLQIYPFNCLFFYIMSFCISSKNKR